MSRFCSKMCCFEVILKKKHFFRNKMALFTWALREDREIIFIMSVKNLNWSWHLIYYFLLQNSENLISKSQRTLIYIIVKMYYIVIVIFTSFSISHSYRRRKVLYYKINKCNRFVCFSLNKNFLFLLVLVISEQISSLALNR